jgi:hypothetical protein
MLRAGAARSIRAVTIVALSETGLLLSARRAKAEPVNCTTRIDTSGLGATGDPLPLAVQRPLLSRWTTPVLSVGLIGAIVWHLRHVDLDRSIPRNPLFWLCLLAYWAAPILSDFVIYRRLWNIPAEGLIALCRKHVGNVLLVDLLGETYFYSWARKKVAMATSPFGAIKDVTILSALAGNVLSLVLVVFSWPRLQGLHLGPGGHFVGASFALVALVSILLVAFGGRLFSLDRGQLREIAAIHLLRILATTGLLALAWSLCAPQVGVGTWLLLATGQVMLTRLPLLVDDNVAFANAVIWFLGPDSGVQQAVAIVAVLALTLNLVAAALLAIGDLATVGRALEPVDD